MGGSRQIWGAATVYSPWPSLSLQQNPRKEAGSAPKAACPDQHLLLNSENHTMGTSVSGGHLRLPPTYSPSYRGVQLKEG